jgi:hypothetical protein
MSALALLGVATTMFGIILRHAGGRCPRRRVPIPNLAKPPRS